MLGKYAVWGMCPPLPSATVGADTSRTDVDCGRDILGEPLHNSSWLTSGYKRDERLGEQGPQEQEVQFQLPPELASGVYANFAVVHHETEHDIILDFCQLDTIPPGSGNPRVVRVVSRVHIARSFVTPLLQAISTNAFQQEDTLRKLSEGESNGP